MEKPLFTKRPGKGEKSLIAREDEGEDLKEPLLIMGLEGAKKEDMKEPLLTSQPEKKAEPLFSRLGSAALYNIFIGKFFKANPNFAILKTLTAILWYQVYYENSIVIRVSRF